MKNKKLKLEVITKVALILILVLAAISFLGGLKLRENQAAETSKRMEEIISKIALEINSQTQNTVSLAKTVAAYQKAGGFGQREEGVEYLKNILKDNPQLVGISLGYEPNADGQDGLYANKSSKVEKYHNDNGRYLVYWSRAGGNFELSQLVGMSNSQYYQEPKRTKEATITEPYNYEGVMMTETAYPIIIDNQFVGVTALDRSLDSLQKFLNQLKPFKTTQFYLLSKDNKVIATSDNKDLITKSITGIEDYNSIFKSLIRSDQSKVTQSDELDEFIAYAPIKLGNWKILMTVDNKEIFSGINKLMLILAGLIILTVIVLSGLLYWIINKSVINPILDTVNFAENIAEGNLDIELLTIEQENEIGVLKESLNKMFNNLKEVIVNLTDTSEDLSAYSQELSASAEEGNATIETTNQLIENMSANIEQISASTEEVTSFAQESVSQTEVGKRKINNTLENINKIDSTVKDTVLVIKDLDDNSQQIGEIIELITTIAEQTNLLALNAAIEAARAGEAGQGFAVVADEIRQLAEETTQATDKITNVIKDTQRKSANGLESVRELEEIVEEGTTIVEETKQTFDQIAESGEETAAQIEQTAVAAEDLAKNSNEVTEASDEIRNMSNEITNSSQELADMAQNLQELIDNFNI